MGEIEKKCTEACANCELTHAFGPHINTGYGLIPAIVDRNSTTKCVQCDYHEVRKVLLLKAQIVRIMRYGHVSTARSF